MKAIVLLIWDCLFDIFSHDCRPEHVLTEVEHENV